jgi:hypothetical protein
MVIKIYTKGSSIGKDLDTHIVLNVITINTNRTKVVIEGLAYIHHTLILLSY